MKKKGKRSPSWEDIVFKNQSRHYGAYFIRKIYARHVFRSVFITLLITGLLLFYPAIIKLFPGNEKEDIAPVRTIKYTELSPPPPIQKNTPPPQKVYEMPPVRKVIKYVEPKVTNKEVEKEEDIPTSKEVKENATGKENVEGVNDADYIAPIQEIVDDRPPEEDKIFDVVEEKPQFEGGMEALYKFISKHLRYPSRAMDKGVEGVVVVSFVINTDGTVAQVGVESYHSLFPECDKEAMRVVQKIPSWKPGKQRGRPVKVRMRIPIRFRLPNAV